MNVAEGVHETYVRSRRVRVIARHLARLIRDDAHVLDIGCGDGELASALLALRPDIRVRGVDTLVRPGTRIPVESFDGTVLPFADDSFDSAVFIDVLHHSRSAEALLGEAARVVRSDIVIKDHRLEGLLAGPTLKFMDRVGNERHGVDLPHDYWTEAHWREVFRRLGLELDEWITQLRLYPPPADWIFGRSLHFIARLSCAPLRPDGASGT